MLKILETQNAKHALEISNKISNILAKYNKEDSMEIKDLEDLRRLSEILKNLSQTQTSNFYLA